MTDLPVHDKHGEFGFLEGLSADFRENALEKKHRDCHVA
jgi:hypothetical protein